MAPTKTCEDLANPWFQQKTCEDLANPWLQQKSVRLWCQKLPPSNDSIESLAKFRAKHCSNKSLGGKDLVPKTAHEWFQQKSMRVWYQKTANKWFQQKCARIWCNRHQKIFLQSLHLRGSICLQLNDFRLGCPKRHHSLLHSARCSHVSGVLAPGTWVHLGHPQNCNQFGLFVFCAIVTPQIGQLSSTVKFRCS